MKTLDVISAALVVIGALNWGLVGFFNWDLVAAIFGPGSVLSRIIYSLVGVGALYWLAEWNAMRSRWAFGEWPGRERPATQL